MNTLGTVTVTVEGLGGIINYQYYTVVNALKAAGCTVVESNDCSLPHDDVQQYLDNVKHRCQQSSQQMPVVVKARHIPWGG